MEPDIRKILNDNLEIARENNKLLKKIVRKGRLEIAFRVLYWLVIISIILSSYYFLQPYIENLQEIYVQVGDSVGLL